MNGHICIDRRQVINSSHIEDLWSLWFQFLHRLRNHQVYEGMAYLPCSAELLWSKVFSSLSILSMALCWPDTSLCPCSPTHTKGFICLFFWAQLLVKPCSPPFLKWFSPCDHSISISQRGNYICWWNKERSRLKEKVAINSYSQRRDFTRGDAFNSVWPSIAQKPVFISTKFLTVSPERILMWDYKLNSTPFKPIKILW